MVVKWVFVGYILPFFGWRERVEEKVFHVLFSLTETSNSDYTCLFVPHNSSIIISLCTITYYVKVSKSIKKNECKSK